MKPLVRLYTSSYQPTIIWIINDKVIGYRNYTCETDDMYGGSFQSLNLLIEFFNETKDLDIWTKSIRNNLDILSKNNLIGSYPDTISGFDNGGINWFQLFCNMTIDKENSTIYFSDFSILNQSENTKSKISNDTVELSIDECYYMLMNYAIRDHTSKLFQLFEEEGELVNVGFFENQGVLPKFDPKLIDKFDYGIFWKKIINQSNISDIHKPWNELQINYLSTLDRAFNDNNIDVNKFLALGGLYPMIYLRHHPKVQKLIEITLDDLNDHEKFITPFDYIRLHFIDVLCFHDFIKLNKYQLESYLHIRNKFNKPLPDAYDNIFTR